MEEPPPYPKDARVGSAPLDDTTPVMIEKSNIMVVGPTGVGKTMMIKILARVLEVPFSMSDCTPFTQAGYIGEDAEVCVQRLLAAADYDVARAEHGIICLDEVDKLAMAKMVNGKDVSGEGVQQALLKIIEGTTLQITAKPEKSSQRPSGNSSNNFSSFNPPAQSPAGAGSHSKPETYSVRTDNILFIFSGAFVGLQKMILDRVSKGSIGFGAPLRSSSNEPNQNSLPASDAPLFRRNRSFPSSRLEGDESFNPLDLVEPQDFQKFGLIPEFIGRIPITTALNALSLPDLVRILTEPRNSLVQQYTALFASSGIELHLTTGALHEIAKEGHKMGTGARGLRSAAEALLWPIMYEVPGSSVRYVLVTEKAARYEAEPEYFSRGQGHRFRAAVKTEEEEWQAKQDAKAGKGVGEVSSFEEFREQAKSGM
jgi:ATP-dependent Clp protease ATP-binding subunit ClpX